MAHCLTFTPLYQPRVWGGQKLNEVFGRTLPTNTPIGESWELVDRPNEQSVVNRGQYEGWSLHRLWSERRDELFGDGFSDERFPILIKILDAAEPLSVQVHPPLSVAKELRGDPKTEIWYFVQTAPDAGVYVGLKDGTSKAKFETALAEGSVADLVHRIPTRPNSFIFIPSGRIHAIDAGNLIFEIQQNSDTTYRVFDWNRVGLNGEPRELQTESRSAHNRRQFAVFQCVSGKVEFAGQYFRPGDLFLATAEGHTKTLSPLDSNTTVLRTTIEKT